MTTNNLNLHVGDSAYTDFNENGIVKVKIIGRQQNTKSQSGVMYQVEPTLKNCCVDSWIDAAWFR